MYCIEIKALEITQPIGDFYCGVIDANILKNITYSDIRRLESDENRELDDYIGIQRPLSESRRKKIECYISNIDATFPNSIIVSIDKDNVEWVPESNTFKIYIEDGKSQSDIAKILDGQHRISGFTDENCYFIDDLGIKKAFQLLVTIFVDCDLSTQANIFATVNLAQTKVNRSLVYDLESLAIAKSPEKTCHDIAVLLNLSKGPFFRRIKRLGVATTNVKNELLTQASFVSNIIKLITIDPISDRNYFLAIEKGGAYKSKYKLESVEYNDMLKCPFRASFLSGRDDVIAINIENFFSAVVELWPNAWEKTNKISVLNKTIGFTSLCRILKVILQKVINNEGVNESRVISVDEFYSILDGGLLDETKFENLSPTTKTAGKIFDMIKDNLAI